MGGDEGAEEELRVGVDPELGREVESRLGVAMRALPPTGAELELFARVFQTEDSQTGVRTFLESGPGKARFEGR